jgi:hypothetical protein
MGKSQLVQVNSNVHRYAGYFLGFSIFGHVGATRVAPLLFLEDLSQYDFSFVANAMQIMPGFSIYLAVFGILGGWHLIYGTRSALATLSGSSVVVTPFPFVLKFVAMLSHLGIISAVLALSGVFYLVGTRSKAEMHDLIFSKIGI